MMEVRLLNEYGDWLAVSCKSLKSNACSHLIWKTENMNWIEVADELEKELDIKKQHQMDWASTAKFVGPINTPFLGEVEKAAAILGVELRQLCFEIICYANRNRFCHIGTLS